MTARERILAKPEPVQVFVRVWIAKNSIDDPDPDYEVYGARALDFWDELVAVFAPKYTEQALAETLVDRLRAQPGWGRILRGSAS